jgi:hypothetical protein
MRLQRTGQAGAYHGACHYPQSRRNPIDPGEHLIAEKQFQQLKGVFSKLE